MRWQRACMQRSACGRALRLFSEAGEIPETLAGGRRRACRFSDQCQTFVCGTIKQNVPESLRRSFHPGTGHKAVVLCRRLMPGVTLCPTRHSDTGHKALCPVSVRPLANPTPTGFACNISSPPSSTIVCNTPSKNVKILDILSFLIPCRCHSFTRSSREGEPHSARV
eukprot:COSAG02_NODE_5991_length_3886_cov_2.197254_2_plen_167_part_00